ncbi:helix-turn-helix domain-containing protein [Streptomyces sp. ISL-66]|uniref:PucR family transcriptional regulator n=1 Tax=Streptomyces sp. ISL-66 TaxID=2819186 RepID=UPI001BE8B336|nr:helix-turn-helix domain-containing protein [Streptomyces sp. ISL-66]MBT2467028.1 helix-turn-helix domain-containing protein [Streptomyces sp. ISL-66]
MCELLNRIWSRPRGEWTRVLRKELPTLAAGMVEELRETIPGFSALVEELDDELVRQRVETALLTALGYREAAAGEQARRTVADRDRGDLELGRGHGHDRARDLAQDLGRDPGQDPDRSARRRGPEAATTAGTGAGNGNGAASTGPPSGTAAAAARAAEPFPGGSPVPLKAVPAQRTAGSSREPARRELFAALTGDLPLPDLVLAELANAAGWPLPVAVRAIAPASPGETQQLAALLDDCLGGMAGGQPCLLVPTEDPEERTALDCALRGRFAAVGHPVAPRDTASSLRWAVRLLSLTPTRAGLDTRAVYVDDHLSTLLLLQDEPLAHALAARWLRPLADLTPRQSERLEVTLLAWLEGGGAPEAAKALSVHPQTVRYRMRQLEKLFGPGLRDPRTRFELELALRSRRLMAQVRLRPSRGSRRARVVAADFRPPLGAGRIARVNGL